MKIFLIGFMGCGKTTLGKKLARRMKLNFIDLDEYIESKESKTVAKIFSSMGEDSFRVMEAENLRLLQNIRETVVSVGGGAPCYHDNMKWMNTHGLSVYLKQSPESLFQRLKSSKGERPLISGMGKGELLEYIQTKLEERREYYEMAHLVIESKSLKARQLEIAVLEALKERYNIS